MENFSLVDMPSLTGTPKPKNTKPKHSLWRFYNSDDELLYVSQKPNPAILMKQEWWWDVAKATVKHYSSLDDIADAKSTAVYNENPKWNAHGRRTEV